MKDKNVGTKKPLLGVIGGMGAQATSRFYDKLHSMQTVASEQDYIDVLIYSITSTPDRTAFILEQSPESPLGSLVHAARTLENASVSLLAMPCVTSHFFYKELTDTVSVPIVNLPVETANFVVSQRQQSVGILATDGTLKSRILQDTLEKQNIKTIIPSDDMQSKLMNVIYAVKQGATPSTDVISEISLDLCKIGADTTILACTELSTLGKIPNTIDVLDVLVCHILKELDALPTVHDLPGK